MYYAVAKAQVISFLILILEGICAISKFESIFMTVLDQVLEAETANEAAITLAKETAAKTVADATVAKQTALAEAATVAAATIESATTAAQTKADTEAAAIMAAATKEATTVKSTIEGKSAELTKSVVDAFNAA